MKGRRLRGAAWRAVRVAVRTAALVAAVAVSAAAALAIAAHLLLTREGVGAFVATQLQEAFHRPVQVADVNVLVLQGIRIRGLRVLEDPGFPGPDFLRSEIVLAKYRWAALLQRRLEFSEIRLVAPRIQLVRREDGVWNVASLIHPGPSAPVAAPPALGLPVSLIADLIAIEGGQVSVEDRVGRRAHRIRSLDLEVRDFSAREPFSFRSSFKTENELAGKRVELRGSADGRVSLAGFRWPEAWVQADKVRIAIDGHTVALTGRVDDLAAPRADLKLRLPRMTSGDLARYRPVPPGLVVPAATARVRFALPEPGVARIDSLDVAADPFKARASGVFRAATGAYSARVTVLPAPLDKLASLWSGLAPKKLAGTGEGHLAVSGVLGSEKPPTLERLNLRLREFSGVFAGGRKVTGADLAVKASDNLSDLEVQAPRGRLTAYGQTLSDVDLALRLKRGDLDLERMNVTWSASHVRMKGRVQRWSNPKSVYVEGAIDRLALQDAINAVGSVVAQVRAAGPKPRRAGPASKKWSQVFKAAIPKSFPAISGKLRVSDLVHPSFNTFNVDLLWELRGISTGLERLNGSVRTGFGPGRVNDIPALENAHKLLRALFLPFVYMHKLNNMAVISAATAYPKTLDFTRIYGEYGLQRGVIDIRVFHVDSPQLAAFADGKVDFPRERVGLHVLTRLTSSRGPLPQYLSDEKGRPSIGFYVKDDLNKPSLELDLRKMGANAIEEALQDGLRRGQAMFSP